MSAINSEQNSRSRVAQHSSYSFSCDDGEGKYTLIGMISHIGKNTGCGHYVCHMKKDDKWIIFNDEKVALSESPPKQHAYVYLFQRDDTIGNPNSSF